MFEFFIALCIFAINVLTPGASFMLIVSQSVEHGRKSGILIASGIATADTIFALGASLGVAAFLSHRPHWIMAVAFLGGLWFIQKGIRIFNKKKKNSNHIEKIEKLSLLQYWKTGFLAGAANPQALIFFTTVFLSSITAFPGISGAAYLVLGVAMVSLLVRSSIAYLITQKKILAFFNNYRNTFEKSCGALMVTFGCKLATPAVFMGFSMVH